MENKNLDIQHDNNLDIVMRAITDVSFAASDEFINWLAESDEHKRLYQDLMLYRQSRLYAQQESQDIEKAWMEFKDSLCDDNHTENMIEYSSRWSRLIKIAISTAAVIVFGVLLLHQNNSSNALDEALSSVQTEASTSDTQTISNKKQADDTSTMKGKEKSLMAYIADYQEMIDHGNVRTEMEVVEGKQGEPKHIVLEDGTEIWVNVGSRISFLKHFGNGPRIVDLKGEAYFKVKHDANNPFVVRTPYFNTVDKGTSFNIKAYDRKTASVTLCEGEVAVSLPQMEKGISLIPGEKITCSANNQLLVNKVNINTMVAWMHGQFSYDGASLEEILNDISRYYGKKIIVQDTEVLATRLKFWANYEDGFLDVMNTLIFTSGIDITMVDGSNCVYIVKHQDR